MPVPYTENFRHRVRVRVRVRVMVRVRDPSQMAPFRGVCWKEALALLHRLPMGHPSLCTEWQ